VTTKVVSLGCHPQVSPQGGTLGGYPSEPEVVSLGCKLKVGNKEASFECEHRQPP